MPSVIAEHGQVELSALVRLVHAHLPARTLATELQQRFGEPILIEHVERGRVKCGSTQIALHAAGCFDDGAWNAEAVETQRAAEADRAGADDQHCRLGSMRAHAGCSSLSARSHRTEASWRLAAESWSSSAR